MSTETAPLVAREIAASTHGELHAYLAGASRDGYASSAHGTYRFTQANEGWLRNLGHMLDLLEHRSWLYREGQRHVWVLETSYKPSSKPLVRSDEELLAFAAGYFDAEGGMPHSSDARLYFQFVQKDRGDLLHLRSCLNAVGISCGRLHNPSIRVDPDYWRFFVRVESHRRFLHVVRSWHPAKRARLIERLSSIEVAVDPFSRGARLRIVGPSGPRRADPTVPSP